jgi:hypothetical protein
VVHTTDLETSIQGFSAPLLAGYLDSLGLPTDNVPVEFFERRFVLKNLKVTIESLAQVDRAKAGIT